MIRRHRFVRGWNGWVTTIESELMLDDRALCPDRRNADGSRLRAIAFRDVYPPNRWRHVAAGLSAFEQRAEIYLQIARVLLGRLPVHASGAVLARASIRLTQPVDVDVMGERRQCRLRHLARQF